MVQCQKKITVKVSDDLHRKFKTIAEKEGTNATQILREMIASFCDDTGALRATT